MSVEDSYLLSSRQSWYISDHTERGSEQEQFLVDFVDARVAVFSTGHYTFVGHEAGTFPDIRVVLDQVVEEFQKFGIILNNLDVRSFAEMQHGSLRRRVPMKNAVLVMAELNNGPQFWRLEKTF